MLTKSTRAGALLSSAVWQLWLSDSMPFSLRMYRHVREGITTGHYLHSTFSELYSGSHLWQRLLRPVLLLSIQLKSTDVWTMDMEEFATRKGSLQSDHMLLLMAISTWWVERRAYQRLRCMFSFSYVAEPDFGELMLMSWTGYSSLSPLLCSQSIFAGLVLLATSPPPRMIN